MTTTHEFQNPFARQILDYLALLGPAPIPRSWLLAVLARSKGFTPKQFSFSACKESETIDELIEHGVIFSQNPAATLIALNQNSTAERLDRIHQNPTLFATYWNALVLLAAERGKAMKPAEINPLLQQEAVQLIHLSMKLAQAQRPLAAIELANRIARPLQDAGKESDAITLFEYLLKQNAPLSDSIRNLSALMNLGNLFHAKRNLPAARQNLEQAIDTGQRLLGRAHRDLVLSHTALAEVLSALQDFTAAHAAIWQAINICRKHYPEGHLSFAKPYSGLATVFANQKKFPEAIKNYQIAIDIWEAHPDSDHLPLAENHLALAAILFKTNNFSAAEVAARKALELRLARVPEDHPKLELHYNLLALIIDRRARCRQDAIPFFEKVLELRSRRLHPNHPDLVATYIFIGNILRAGRRYPEAQTHMEKYLSILTADPASNLRKLAAGHMSLAKLLQNHGDQSRAPDHIDLALEFYEKLFPAESPDLAAKYLEAAELYRVRKEFPKAIKLVEKAHAISSPKINSIPLSPEGSDTLIKKMMKEAAPSPWDHIADREKPYRFPFKKAADFVQPGNSTLNGPWNTNPENPS